MKKDLVHIGKYISKILRHDPEDLVMDKNGWINVKDLLLKLKIDKQTLDEIVETNEKKRFSYNEDQTKIRANQGHSISVDVQLKEALPPFELFHGTSSKVVDLIMTTGLKSMSRQHVHLSSDKETAKNVGDRHSKSKDSKTVILLIDTESMIKDGYKFYLSENNVWLTTIVPAKYIKKTYYV